MLYVEFMSKVRELALGFNDETEEFYIEPDYEAYMQYAGLKPENVTDVHLTKEDIRYIMDLQIKKMNVIYNPVRASAIEIYDILNNEVQPSLSEETNDLVKNLIEYMQKNDELKEREKKITSKENSNELNKIIGKHIPNGINFTKKTSINDSETLPDKRDKKNTVN